MTAGLPPLMSALPAETARPPSAADRARQRADAAAEARKAELAAVREKGLYAWSQQRKLQALRDRILREIMAERGMDEGSLPSLEPKQRASLEEEIARRIKEAVQDAQETATRDAVAQGRPPKAMIIDISV